MAVAQQTADAFELDEYDSVSDQMASELGKGAVLPGFDVPGEAGNLGLHLGVLRRFAELGAPRSSRPDR